MATFNFQRKIRLEPGGLGYLILCINSQKGYIGDLTLGVWTDKKIKNIQSSENLFKKAHTYRLKGIWVKENAGGSLSEENFYKNPQYEIETKAGGNVFIELECSEPYPLSICLFESQGKHITELDTASLNNVITNQVLTPDSAHLSVTLKPNSQYLLMPATYRPMQVRMNC